MCLVVNDALATVTIPPLLFTHLNAVAGNESGLVLIHELELGEVPDMSVAAIGPQSAAGPPLLPESALWLLSQNSQRKFTVGVELLDAVHVPGVYVAIPFDIVNVAAEVFV
jgi:hypothetical protein